MKLNKKWRPYLFAAFMSLGVGFFMALILTLVNTSLTSGFIEKWIKAFGIGICISFLICSINSFHGKQNLDSITDEQE